MGSILENVMAQQLRCNGLNLHFFDAKKYGELDFVVQNGLHVELIEVKSGKDYKSTPLWIRYCQWTSGAPRKPMSSAPGMWRPRAA